MGWTKKQEKAIDTRGRNILVSAAAGSGKTAVLVERIIKLITEDGIDINELLVMTFTRAAASEMKERVRKRLEELSAMPEDGNVDKENIERQLSLIHSAKISTIDSFCNDIVRAHFEEVDIDPDFRIADENENAMLLADVIDEVLMDEYEKSEPEFLKFASNYTKGKVSDKDSETGDIPKMITNLYNDSMRHPQPFKWLEKCKENAREYTMDEFNKLPFIKEMRLWPNASDFFKYHDKDLQEEEIKNDLNLANANARVLIDLTVETMNRLNERKKELGILDFDDITHYTLDILCKEDEETGERVPSDTARDIQKEYKEIMIDEYQDSNYLQDELFRAVSNGHNMFMVGDVKQSIYRFRKAEPKMFMDKFNSFEEDLNADDCKIILEDNFRSREEIINSVNFIFDYIMREDAGGIEYVKDHRLNHKMEYPDSGCGNDTEYILIENKGNSLDREQEAKYVAHKIKELVDPKRGIKVQSDEKDADGKNKMRNARYRDFAILLRKVKDVAPIYEKALADIGIPSYRDKSEGYYESMEVKSMTDFLKVLDNPEQDIPLSSLMLGEMFRFSEDDLAKLRINQKNGRLYLSIINYLENGDDADLKNRLQDFWNTISVLRSKIPYMTVAELIDEMLEVTKYDLFVRALPNGKQRVLNLESLKEKARDYEEISFTGLFNFVRYIEKMEYLERDDAESSEVTEEDDTVLISTIHKSKGLQFPIVFMSDCNSERKGNSDSALTDEKAFVGIDSYDEELRIRNTSILKDYLKQKDKDEDTAERLRYLYVALTRAKEKLFITSLVKQGRNGKGFENKLEAIEKLGDYDADRMEKKDILAQRTFAGWLDEAIARKGHEDANLKISFVSLDDVKEMVEKQNIEDDINRVGIEELKSAEVPEDIKSILDERFGFTYSYADDVKQHAKLTVTEIKKMANEEDEDSSRPFDVEKKTTDIRVPAFMEEVESEEKLTGAKRGSAYHKVLEHIDMKYFSADKAEEVLNQMLDDGQITELERKSVDEGKLAKFAESDLFKRMKAADERGELKKEQPFIMCIPVKEINPDSDSDESVVVQGIIDVCFMEDGRYVIADYKTDRVDDMQSLVNSYHVQLEFYKKALEAASGNEVSELIIYSVELDDQITL